MHTTNHMANIEKRCWCGFFACYFTHQNTNEISNGKTSITDLCMCVRAHTQIHNTLKVNFFQGYLQYETQSRDYTISFNTDFIYKWKMLQTEGSLLNNNIY